MSSLRNAVQRRNHKERGQLRSRQRYGILEKHKDYVLRAKDYHSKQERLKAFREKAYFRNPDEFYFKMINSKTKNGAHILEHDSALSGDAIKLMKSQDLNYVKTQRDLGNKKIEKLQNELHFIESESIEDEIEVDDKIKEKVKSSQPQHIIFVDTLKEVKTFDPAKYFNTLPELVNRKFNRPRIETLQNEVIMAPDDEIELLKLHKNRLEKHQELSSRIRRQEELRKVEQGLRIQKNLMGKGRRKKVGVDKDGLPLYKWKNERKK
ncbi:U3 small nucleolar RNA-associated protein 11 [Rhizophagus irregularis]|uniref:U3 small nucleolar RNA-associated protein 11 n=4 Tax=Rhizophagus irregularis TaxID=588596 RepID=U9U2T5_RHIID|nr:small-subunit processome [Rhizophagus irregularis DAOM 181602=DAOM 197198]EXX75104.1 Utp11p [Rhizophagus irregularis DAOM 197198w]PKC04631.1 U3 small nucleolar RNA-associated protein 11 [Rhizophagus irregularis]PKC64485.1 U3 small nucleolar RNA-associated protein 11 [Rhizophagus irregularis]PKY20718.1 U3 small nucleolar RNA-associated protein 11 [Rhizophagus irregularis]POG72141.1 small-subunit processome [Rhizophagus irregularis DAOM 181602=DAOM 197198]|eukprot:XP_025179007.1 small-subunit processome [Rhizophagus irregularis DAOM 181602=DAOM 197198]